MNNRKAFNFYRSYWEVAKQLSDKDRLKFFDAIMTRQFTGVEIPLEGISSFAYISQKHNIDSQVVGYCKKMGIDAPIVGGSVGGTEGGSVQEKGEEKGEVQYVSKSPKGGLTERENGFLIWFNGLIEKKTGKKGKFKTLSKTDKNNLKQLRESYSEELDWESAFNGMWNSKWCQETGNVTPTHLLRVDNFNKYLNGQSGGSTSAPRLTMITIADHD